MPTSLDEDFAAAQIRARALVQTPSAHELLGLYGLYKQATAGDVSGSPPGMFDLKGRAKHEAWSARKGMSKDAAMQAYIDLVDELARRYV
jgi:diazepam-binding inhibitor (GABA receptor modulating acyl-CoA-binding protein)